MPGADVIITNEQNGETRRGVTNDVGSFTFAALAPGPYTVRAELTGFRPIMSRGITVLASSRLAVPPLVLQVDTLSEAVTVSAVAEAVATTTTSHQAVLDLSQVENLSIRGRNPISLLKILPGVSLQNNDQELFEGSFATGVPDVQGGRGQTLSVEPASSAATAATRAAAQPQRRDQHRRDRRSQRANERVHGRIRTEGRLADQLYHQERRVRVTRFTDLDTYLVFTRGSSTRTSNISFSVST